MSTPMPNALVAAMASSRPARKSSCTRDALVVRHPGVIPPGAESVAGKHLGPELDASSGWRRRRCRAGPSPPTRRRQCGRLVLPAAAGLDGQRQVRALEAGDEIERVAEPELHGDVGSHLRRGRGGECRGRHAQVGADAGEPPVVGPEIVPPLADAVRFVDHDQARGPARPSSSRKAPLASRSGAT